MVLLLARLQNIGTATIIAFIGCGRLLFLEGNRRLLWGSACSRCYSSSCCKDLPTKPWRAVHTMFKSSGHTVCEVSGDNKQDHTFPGFT